MLFEVFNDSALLFSNGQLIWHGYIDKSNNPSTSSGYSGITIKLPITKEKVTVRFELKGQRKYIEFTVTDKYPIYTIQRYGSTWYVNARNYLVTK